MEILAAVLFGTALLFAPPPNAPKLCKKVVQIMNYNTETGELEDGGEEEQWKRCERTN